MKKNHLIRHAKSSWADRTLEDIERPLNKRDLKSCRIMAKKIAKAGCRFDNVVCSPAVRVQSTIEHMSKHLKVRDIVWESDDALYCFDSQALLAWCRSLDDSISEVVIVGHNPAITDFCNSMCGSRTSYVPTCAYAQLSSSKALWHDFSEGAMKLAKFLTPKMFT